MVSDTVWHTVVYKHELKYISNRKLIIWFLKYHLNETCRRQILLDALGAEKAPCTGCDICQGIAPPLYDDAEYVYNYIEEHAGAYTVYETADNLSKQLYKKPIKLPFQKTKNKSLLGYKPLLEIQDYMTILNSLIDEKKITKRKWLWKNALFVKKN